MAAGAVRQGRELPLGHRMGGGPQLLEQGLHGGFGVGHFGGQAHLGPVGVAEAAGLLAPQGEDALDQRPVVARGRFVAVALAGGPAHVGLVHLLPQRPAAAVFHEWRVAGHVEPQQPWAGGAAGLGIAGGAGRLGQLIQQAWRQPLHLFGAGEPQGPAVGGIEHLVAEAGGKLRQFLAGGVERLLLGAAEAHAPQLHVPPFGLEDAPLGGVEGCAAGGRLLGQLLQGPEDHLALAGAVAEGHHRRLLGGMGLPQLGAVADAVEVAHHPPAPAQALTQALQRVHQLPPGQGGAGGQAVLEPLLQGRQFRLQLRHQGGDVGAHRLRRDRVVAGQALTAQEFRNAGDHGGGRAQGGRAIPTDGTAVPLFSRGREAEAPPRCVGPGPWPGRWCWLRRGRWRCGARSRSPGWAPTG